MKYLERARGHFLYLSIRGNQSRSDTSRSHIYAHEEIHVRRSCGQIASAISRRTKSTKRSALSLGNELQGGNNHQPTILHALIMDTYSKMT